jgi:hypothetical protein
VILIPDADDAVVVDQGVAQARPLEEVAGIPLTGRPEVVAERLAEYRSAGASHALIGIADGDWRAQVELLAEVKDLMKINTHLRLLIFNDRKGDELSLKCVLLHAITALYC